MNAESRRKMNMRLETEKRIRLDTFHNKSSGICSSCKIDKETDFNFDKEGFFKHICKDCEKEDNEIKRYKEWQDSQD